MHGDDANTAQDEPVKRRIVIAGGGVAGLEAALALADLAGDLAEIALVSPEADFLYKPLTVEEPFTSQPASRMELAPLLREISVAFVPASVKEVRPQQHEVVLGAGGGSSQVMNYDTLVVCIGGRARPVYSKAETFWSSRSDLPIDAIIRDAASERKSIAFVIPPGTSWPLPLYELAMLTRRRTEQLGLAEVALRIYTPEDAPLLIFGRPASEAVSDVLRARKIELELEASVIEGDPGDLRVLPGRRALEASTVIALPRIEGAAIAGLPVDDHGFIPIDASCRVVGASDVYAAGDGTSFPVKQGGLATQQADVVAEQIAADLGAPVTATEFKPVLRGQLITGDESLNLKHELSGGHGEGDASLDYLWWPPQKIGGRYLSALIAKEPVGDLEPRTRTLEVEVSFPHEWHGNLLSWDAEVPSE